MMKFISAAGLCLLLSVSAFAQDAHEGTIRYKKEDRSGVLANYDVPQSMTEDALTDRLKSMKLGKKHKESGFWKYEGVNWPEIAPTTIDVYFHVDRVKGRTEVSMLVSPGNGNFVTSATDPAIINNMSAFLNRFGADAVAWQNRLALEAQQKSADEAARDLAHANRETDRANRRSNRADKEKAEKQQQLDEEQKKLDDLKKAAQPTGN